MTWPEERTPLVDLIDIADGPAKGEEMNRLLLLLRVNRYPKVVWFSARRP